MALFDVKPLDHRFYEERLAEFLPDRIIDIHTHVWLETFKKEHTSGRVATWPARVAKSNPIEDLLETYRLLFPGKQVTPLIFSNLGPGDDFSGANQYIQASAKQYGFPALLFANPTWTARELEESVITGAFLGCKVYLNMADPSIPEKEIRIFDFLPHHQLEVLNRHGWLVMLHIPRCGRLKDPLNLAQMLEIEHCYPNVKLIIAHVGRAYCPEDVGPAFEVLADTKNMLFDFSANTNQGVFEQLIRCVGPKRILFGSDLPILRMRTRRICEDGNYVNLIPKGLYGDVAGDRHLREVAGTEADNLTFFMYEEIEAFKCAVESTGLGRSDVEDIFYNNAAGILDQTLY